MTKTQTLLTEREAGIVVLHIDRPARRNALDPATYQALSAALLEADADASIHAIVLTGTKGHFTAGNDLQEFQNRGGGESAGIAFLRTLVKIETPIVTAVEGYALGVGVTLLQHCDFVYVARNATLRLPFVSLGLCPEGASSLLLARIVGQRTASDWLLSSRSISGDQAHQAGFATDACLPGEALSAALDMARHLTTQPRDALRLTKVMLRKPLEDLIDQTLTYEAEHFAQRLNSDEAQAAFKRFFQKSKDKSADSA